MLTSRMSAVKRSRAETTRKMGVDTRIAGFDRARDSGHASGRRLPGRGPTSSSADYRSAQTPSVPLPAPNYSTSCCSPTSSEPIGSASSGASGEPRFAELLIDCEEDRTLRAGVVVRLHGVPA